MRDPSLTALLDAIKGGSAPEALAEAATMHFGALHPTAGAEIRSAAVAVVYYATDGERIAGPSPALEQWLARVLDRVNPSDAPLAVSLVDALVFLPRPGSDAAAGIREAVDILHATRHTFKSKQIERVRKILEALIP